MLGGYVKEKNTTTSETPLNTKKTRHVTNSETGLLYFNFKLHVLSPTLKDKKKTTRPFPFKAVESW